MLPLTSYYRWLVSRSWKSFSFCATPSILNYTSSVLSQTSLTLTKFVETYINVYNLNYQISFIKFSMKYVLIVPLFELLDVHICFFFLKTCSREVWFMTNPKWTIIWSRGSNTSHILLESINTFLCTVCRSGSISPRWRKYRSSSKSLEAGTSSRSTRTNIVCKITADRGTCDKRL